LDITNQYPPAVATDILTFHLTDGEAIDKKGKTRDTIKEVKGARI
jgi:hypothetical protein